MNNSGSAKEKQLPSEPEQILDIFLQPGEIYWSNDSATRIRTLLGSCVSICLWHPVRKIGGMCHYLLPKRPQSSPPADGLDPRYGEEAIRIFLQEISAVNTHPGQYIAKVFGGGQMFQTLRPGSHIGDNNVDLAYRFLKETGIQIAAHDHGGTRDRRLMFDLWSGNVWMKRKTLGQQNPDGLKVEKG